MRKTKQQQYIYIGQKIGYITILFLQEVTYSHQACIYLIIVFNILY